MQSRFRFVLFLVVLMMLTPLVTPVTAQDQIATDIPLVTILASAEGLDVPTLVPEGIVTVVFDNQMETPFFAEFVRVNEGMTAEEVLAVFAEDEEAALPLVSMMGGTEIAPESVGQITYEFLPGEYIMLDWPIEGDGPPEIYIFTVEDGEAVTDIEPQEDMVVNLIDFAFAIPAELEAGTWLWEVHNTGEQWHELVFAPVEEGTTLEEVTAMVMEAIMADPDAEEEPTLIPSFIWSPMAAGSRAWFNITLEPGTYVVVCGLPDLNNDSGHTHLEEGMIQIVMVR